MQVFCLRQQGPNLQQPSALPNPRLLTRNVNDPSEYNIKSYNFQRIRARFFTRSRKN